MPDSPKKKRRHKSSSSSSSAGARPARGSPSPQARRQVEPVVETKAEAVAEGVRGGGREKEKGPAAEAKPARQSPTPQKRKRERSPSGEAKPARQSPTSQKRKCERSPSANTRRNDKNGDNKKDPIRKANTEKEKEKDTRGFDDRRLSPESFREQVRERKEKEKGQTKEKGKDKEQVKEKDKSKKKDKEKKRAKAAIPAGVFEAFLPDDRAKASDSKQSKDGKDRKHSKDSKDNKDSKDSKDNKESKDSEKKERKDGNDKKPEKTGSAVDKGGGGFDKGGAAAKGGNAEKGGIVAEAPAAKPRAGLGDLAELAKRLEEDRGRAQLQMIKAKAELEEQKETTDRKERRQREYYKATLGEPVGPKNRFLVEAGIGQGAFSTVYRCRDMQARENGPQDFAVKFVRKNTMLRQATEREVKMYRRLRNNASVEDPEGTRHLMNLGCCETFEHQGHLAVVFPLMRCDMRAGLKKYGQGDGLPLEGVALYSKQIFMALRALRKVKVIHTDLKPENMLMSLDKSLVKLADFGSAMDLADRVRTDEAQPRYYRAPEVILGVPYTTQIDMWSAGCTVFEFATGRFLFTGDHNNGMLNAIMQGHGGFSKSFATSGEFASKHFTADGEFMVKDQANLPMSSFPKPAKPLHELIASLLGGSHDSQHKATVQLLTDLIARCTTPDPEKRATPEQAIAHHFFKKKSS